MPKSKLPLLLSLALVGFLSGCNNDPYAECSDNSSFTEVVAVTDDPSDPAVTVNEICDSCNASSSNETLPEEIAVLPVVVDVPLEAAVQISKAEGSNLPFTSQDFDHLLRLAITQSLVVSTLEADLQAAKAQQQVKDAMLDAIKADLAAVTSALTSASTQVITERQQVLQLKNELTASQSQAHQLGLDLNTTTAVLAQLETELRNTQVEASAAAQYKQQLEELKAQRPRTSESPVTQYKKLKQQRAANEITQQEYLELLRTIK